MSNGDDTRVYELPGATVFPESIGIDPRTGTGYVGSLADGTLFALEPDGGVTVFAAAGDNGRASVAGVKVDARGRLWAAGGYEGTLDVIAIGDGELLARHLVGSPSCVNDIAFGPDGAAYVTDSLLPTLFRVHPETLELTPFVDLAAAGVPWPDGLNLNGIVLCADECHLVCCQTNTGRFWRIAIADGDVSEVTVEGGPLEHCDGLARAGDALYVAINAENRIVVVELDRDGGAGRVAGDLRSDAFRFPTAVASAGDRLLVVNGQLDRMGSEPQLPFTVVSVARPAA